jgi:hypothetical protein
MAFTNNFKNKIFYYSIRIMSLSGTNLGGGIQGISTKQTINGHRSSEHTMLRRVLRDGWNTNYARGNVEGLNRVTTPFRAVNNSGDFLGRVNYVCGGPNQVNASYPGWKSRIGSIISNCDNTNIPSSTCNVKFVADSSDYTRFKHQNAYNHTYNDKKFGGDESNASYVPLNRVRRR